MANKIDILFQDDFLLIVDKPAGVLSVPGRDGGRGLTEIVAEQYKIEHKLFLVHRLDRDTSGVMLLARSPDAQREMSRQFAQREVEKEYLALVRGQPDEESGLVVAPIGEHPRISGKMVAGGKHPRNAKTRWNLVEKLGAVSLVRCRPQTGRQHQIRVHMQLMELPLLVDPLYSETEAFYLSQVKPNYKASTRKEERPLIARLSLHAAALAFDHPQTGSRMRIEAELPKDFRSTLNQLRKIAR